MTPTASFSPKGYGSDIPDDRHEHHLLLPLPSGALARAVPMAPVEHGGLPALHPAPANHWRPRMAPMSGNGQAMVVLIVAALVAVAYLLGKVSVAPCFAPGA